MEIGATILLRENAAPVAANSLGFQLLRSEEWSRLQPELPPRLMAGGSAAVFPVYRKSDVAPWIVWLTPLTELQSGRNGWALCFVFDPEERAPIARSLLQTIYRLTPAEARLAEQLLLGRCPAEAAEALGVTIHTVRTYLKRLFRKTGAKTQAVLVCKLMQASSLSSVLTG